MILQAKTNDFMPHPAGIHPAVCVDVIDLGLVETEYQGERRAVHKVRVVFESEQRGPDGRALTVSRSFTASLSQKARLAEFLGQWRGRPIVPGDQVDLDRLVGTSCTLVISHQQGSNGVYASIDGVSRPTRKVLPSGTYDPEAARQRIAERQARVMPAAGARGTMPRGSAARPAAAPVAAAPASAEDSDVGF